MQNHKWLYREIEGLYQTPPHYFIVRQAHKKRWQINAINKPFVKVKNIQPN